MFRLVISAPTTTGTTFTFIYCSLRILSLVSLHLLLRCCAIFTWHSYMYMYMYPLLFIIYINGICNTSDIISFCLFADDISLVYSNSNVNAAVELVNISNWLLANKLCINSLKSNFIFFSKHKNYSIHPIRIEWYKSQ